MTELTALTLNQSKVSRSLILDNFYWYKTRK